MQSTPELSIAALQQQIDDWIKKYGKRYFSELTNLGILMEETGELSRHVSRIYGEQSYRPPAPSEAEQKQMLQDEMADVLWVLCCLANQTGIDLAQAIQKNIVKKTERDAERHWGNDKL
ncbi:MAG: nucleotide pyrophosphohydrolase [Chitinophagaceae bacterium]